MQDYVGWNHLIREKNQHEEQLGKIVSQDKTPPKAMKIVKIIGIFLHILVSRFRGANVDMVGF